MARILLLAFFFCSAQPLFAIQEDVNPILRHPDFLFSGNEEAKTNFLSAKAFKGGFGVYLKGDQDHVWQFKSAEDVGFFSFGKNMLWRTSFMVEGLADSGKDKKVEFRMRQTGYDLSTAFELLHNEDDVFYIGYHHRCRHGSDHVTDQNVLTPDSADSYDSRVVMRSGLEIGYKAIFRIGAFNLISNSDLNTYLWGQNIDISFQPRLALSSVLQVEYARFKNVTPFFSAGLGTAWITSSNDKSVKHYCLWSPVNESRWRFSPAAALGFSLPGSVGDFRVFASYTSKLDTGFGKTTKDAHFILFSAEFWL